MAFCSFAWSGAEATTVTGTFNVQVIIAATRVLNSATNLNFGTAGVLAAPINDQSTITVICTNTTPYNIGLDKGLNGGSVTTREMKGVVSARSSICGREPPPVELQPAQDYVARVVRITKKPVGGEEAYRLFIDELPKAPRGPRTVNLVMRHSIPLFFDAPGSFAPEAAWRVTQKGHVVSFIPSLDDHDP